MNIKTILFCLFFGYQQLFGQTPTSDAILPIVLCNSEAVVIPELQGPGTFIAENQELPCLTSSFPETNVAWLKWQIEGTGTLGFTILPMDEKDDIDFILYRLTGEWDSYDKRTVVRCMATGESNGEISSRKSMLCTGATGLRPFDKDEFEQRGCQSESNNFLAEVSVNTGEIYLLFINNYHSPNGVMLEFTGSAKFSDSHLPCAIAEIGAPNYLHNSDGYDVQIGDLYPNPTSSTISANISLGMANRGFAHIINAQGITIETIPLDLEIGNSTFTFQIDDLLTGVYFIKYRIGDFLKVQRFVRL